MQMRTQTIIIGCLFLLLKPVLLYPIPTVMQNAHDQALEETNAPVLESAKFFYDDFDYDSFEFINPIFELLIKWKGETPDFLIIDTGIRGYGQDYFFGHIFPPDVSLVSDSTYILKGNWTWDQYITFTMFTKNEVFYGDTLYTNDYITDENILEAITPYSDIENLSADNDFALVIANDEIVLSERVKQIHLYSATGELILYKNNCNYLDLGNVRKGIFILTIKTLNGKSIIKKLLL